MKATGFLALAGLALALTGIAAGQAKPIDANAKQAVVARVSELIDKYAYVPGIDFEKWPDILKANQEKVDAAQTDEDLARAINGALHQFSASHIVLATPRNAEMRRTASNTGIGIMTAEQPDGLLIVRVYPDAPAAKAGLQPGDIVTQVEGKKVQGIAGIPGPEGTTVSITVKRRATGKTESFNIVRKKYSLKQPETISMVNADTAMITIPTFDLTYDAKKVESLFTKANGSRNLILDLRDNGGGAVVNLLHTLSMFLPEDQPIGTFVNRKSVSDYEEATGDTSKDIYKIADWAKLKLKPMHNDAVTRYRGNVVVLVNGGTGSASEMAAAALKETMGATVIGSKSAGAVLVSVIVPATNGFTLQYPLSDYVTVKGTRLEGNGVTPDIAAKDPLYRLPGDVDDAVKKSLDNFAKIKTGAKSTSG